MAFTVFKTDGPEHLGTAGSIPVRLRQSGPGRRLDVPTAVQPPATPAERPGARARQDGEKAYSLSFWAQA